MGSERILIVGGGVAGLSTAWWLARRGARDVVLVEREASLATHSSRKNAAILRTATDEEDVEALAIASAARLSSPPEGFADRPLVDACGILIAVQGPESGWERRALEDGRAERLSEARTKALAPALEPDGRRGLWFPREGRIDIEALLAGFERGARAGGVRIECASGAVELLARDGAVLGARFPGGREIRAERTLVAAGGWAGANAIAAGSRVRLRPTRRHLVVTADDARVDPRGPVMWVEDDAFYARPESGGLMLCACDEVDADADDTVPVAAERERALEKAGRWLPSLAPFAVARWWMGIRTLAADRRFVIGADPDVAGLYWCAGLGGHGMLASFEVGKLATDALLGVREAARAP
jgi:glycine/D-amino acid oxidase-like deaminating enzyme